MNISLIIVIVLFTLGIVIGGWYYGRIINYKLSYKNQVKETIREMIKEEYLK